MSKQKGCSCSNGVKLIFACSGGSDVGEIADRAARKLTREGAGKMFCLTGIDGRVASLVKTAKAADTILAIDGCAQDCARHCLEEAGFSGFSHLQLGAIGMEKGLSPATDEAVAKVATAGQRLLTS